MPLVTSILKGISDTADADFQRITVKEEQADLIKSISNSAGTNPTEVDEKVKVSSIKKVTGGVLPIAYHSSQFKARRPACRHHVALDGSSRPSDVSPDPATPLGHRFLFGRCIGVFFVCTV